MNVTNLLDYTISVEDDLNDKLHSFLHNVYYHYVYRIDRNLGGIVHTRGKFWSCIIVKENGFEVDRRNAKKFLENL